MWSDTPTAIPQAWRREGARELADAIGYGTKLGHGPTKSNSLRDAYIWYDAKDLRQTLSFEVAHHNACELACLIRANGIVSGQLQDVSDDLAFTCALVLRRTASLPLSQLASFKAGATFVPCDPTWPVERTIGILTEANAGVALIDSSDGADELTALLLQSTKVSAVIQLDEKARVMNVKLSSTVDSAKLSSTWESVKARLGIDVSSCAWSPPEVMYLMYTSGSTGKPKGCVVPSSGVWHRFKWGESLLGFTPSDTFILKTPATFDCSIPEMWVPLYIGCTSVIVPDGQHLDFEVVKRTMERTRVTVAHFVPSVLALFLDFVSPGELPALRQISCTGEALLLSHRQKLTSRLGRPLPLFNLYGPTEASVEVTYFDARDDTPGAAHGFPIGYAGDGGVLMYVTDPADPTKLVADGQKGEVCIGGIQVAYGYLNRPELTAEKFVVNPHGAAGLLYRTGDLGVRSIDGKLEYHGRADRQVKVGGVRIELGEIEAVALKCFPQLLNIAVEKVDGRLVGVASPRPGQTPPAGAEIPAALAREVPAAYVPAEWHFRDELPLGSAGKVDHKRVVAWLEDQSKASTWGAIYDELYFADEFQVDDGVADPTMDWAAYTDSFTGEMHERATIQEWVDETVREVLVRRPSSVVEMGCGKGMILFRVAADAGVREYVGCDLSKLAVRHVERVWRSHVAKDGVECQLSTFVRDASNFGGLPDRSFEAIVCNGVSMYFPSAEYLVEVLRSGLPKLTPTGCYHFGDVISKAHYDLFLLRRSRHFEGTFEQLQQPAFRDALLSAAKDRCFESELFFALHLNGSLPGVAAVEVQLKHGAIMSEFSRYRYNVLLHLGQPPDAPLALVAVPEDDRASRQTAQAIGTALQRLACASPRAVVACHAISNARLTADYLLASGIADAAAPAVQNGVGEGGGVDPAALRAALAEALPGYHVVIQWARDGRVDHMDAYAFPLPPSGAYPVGGDHPPPTTAMLAPGLLAIARAAVATIGEAALIDRAANVESFTNQLQSIDHGSDGKDASSEEAAAAEAKRLWDSSCDVSGRQQAVLTLLGAKLGLSAAVDPTASFSASGGNSFLAMQTIGSVRALFGVGLPVFDLLTKSFGDFAAGVASQAAGGGSTTIESWIHSIDHLPPGGQREAPTFVLFPQAGSSPKQYAALYQELARHCPVSRFLFVQPPGRDARVDEPNETSVSQYIGRVSTALSKQLLSTNSTASPTIFVGDSWGAIAAFAVAHELYEAHNWAPTHVAVSGNASPEVTTTHRGLGCYSSKPMAELGDAELVAFLHASGVGDVDEGEMDALVQAFRADCQLYEDYVRPDHRRPLPSRLCVMRGAKDQVVTARETSGWLDEFECDEAKFVTIPDATHHLHEERPAAVATAIIKFAELLSSATVPSRAVIAAKELALPAGRISPGGRVSPSTPSKDTIVLEPPCGFVRGVDAEALQAYREGNLMYRMGSPYGSKGEIESLPFARVHSREWPERTASPL